MTRTPRPITFLLGWPGNCIALAFGFAEATLFFIVPDVLITLIALFAGLRAWRSMAMVTVGAVLGHKSQVSTARYAHLAQDKLRRAVDQIGNRKVG